MQPPNQTKDQKSDFSCTRNSSVFAVMTKLVGFRVGEKNAAAVEKENEDSWTGVFWILFLYRYVTQSRRYPGEH